MPDEVIYLSIKTKNPVTVNQINDRQSNVEFDGLNVLQNLLKTGQIVFIVLGGDKPGWETGLAGVGTLSREPYDVGYSGKNFKVQVDIKVLLGKPIKREDLLPYRDAYGTIGIGPITKWEPNQALTQVQEKNALALFRAMIDLCPDSYPDIARLLDRETMERVESTAVKMLEIPVRFGQDEKKAAFDYLKNSGDKQNKLLYRSGFYSKFPRNRIIFGAPGTGKSFLLEKERKCLTDDDSNYERVTFHPDYTYANFVGTYKPVMACVQTDDKADAETRSVISELADKTLSAQQKYDILYDRFGGRFPELPLLVGIATGERFEVQQKYPQSVSFDPENGIALRKYLRLIDGNSSTSEISYEYVPGPFMRVYVSALKSARSGNPEPHLLIIEEINRANPAAVFGDIFQLLDRGADNVSEYPVQASEDVKKYLSKELGGSPDDYASIRIPDNMFIWASMNSADQGVFPMDTAFKRRWNFTYIGIDESDGDIRGKFVTLEMPDKRKVRFEWNELRKAINNFLAKEKINEDKQLGPYFIPRSIVVPAGGGNEIDSKDFCDVFKHKVIMYLFEDAAKQKRAKVFAGCKEDANRYSKICERFDIEFLGIFDNAIQNDAHAEYIMESLPASPGNGGVKEQTS